MYNSYAAFILLDMWDLAMSTAIPPFPLHPHQSFLKLFACESLWAPLATLGLTC